jgi:3-oxoacyl-(acyl-carrier-protein) synthase
MGHLISAAGAVEAAVCAPAIWDGIAPVNANLVQAIVARVQSLIVPESRGRSRNSS